MLPKVAQVKGYLPRILSYKTYKEALENYNPRDRWEVFSGSPQRFNIAYECVDRYKEIGGDAIKIMFHNYETQVVRYDELSRYTSQFANTIAQLGVNKGDRVVICGDHSLEFYVAFFGTMKRGAVAVTCSILFGPEAIEYRVRNSEAKLLVIPEAKLRELRGINIDAQVIRSEDLINYIKDSSMIFEVDTSVDDLAVMQYTSGTTGLPKPIPYRHKGLVNVVPAAVFGGGAGPSEERAFSTSSVAWGHGVWGGVVAPLAFGTTAHVYSGPFNPKVVLKALEDFRITSMSTIPTALRKILTENIKDYHLEVRKITYTGEPLDLRTFYRVKETLGVEPHSVYGATETGTVILDYMYPDYKVKPGSLGKPLLGLRVAVIDENGNVLPPGEVGDIAVTLPGLDRWYRIGDSGYMDEEGYFWYKGRSDDVIKTSGYRVGPEEVELVINEHPAVEESAVIGIPDEVRGNVIKAFVKLKEGYKPSDELRNEIMMFVKERLAKYAYPREIEFIDEIPKTVDGKIRRKLLREMEMRKK